MYFKYHVSKNGLMSNDNEELFDAINNLLNKNNLEEDEVLQLKKNKEVINKKLPIPEYYNDGNSIGAETWFKDNGYDEELLACVEFYVKVLRKYKSSIVYMSCNAPGEIIYEDEYQIGVLKG